ncbi:hypothetical protein ACLOJK_038416 [Asimina triloba]
MVTSRTTKRNYHGDSSSPCYHSAWKIIDENKGLPLIHDAEAGPCLLLGWISPSEGKKNLVLSATADAQIRGDGVTVVIAGFSILMASLPRWTLNGACYQNLGISVGLKEATNRRWVAAIGLKKTPLIMLLVSMDVVSGKEDNLPIDGR